MRCMSVKLKLLVSDTRVQTKYALEETYNLAKRNCVGYIGAWNSGTTIEVSNLLSIPSIDRAIIAYSASSPRLSERDFSNVLRTKESDAVPTKLMAKLMTGLICDLNLYKSRYQTNGARTEFFCVPPLILIQL